MKRHNKIYLDNNGKPSSTQFNVVVCSIVELENLWNTGRVIGVEMALLQTGHKKKQSDMVNQSFEDIMKVYGIDINQK